MNLVDLSIKRPAFITCIMIVIITIGVICFKNMSVDLYPEVDIPTVYVATSYEGAGPAEIESLITKPLEEEISTISGIKRLTSRSMQDSSRIIINFFQGVDIKYAEQQIRDKVNQARGKLPDDIREPVIRQFDPDDQEIMTIAISADLSTAELFDLAEQYISPRLEQVESVGMVEISGGRKREIAILLDQEKLKSRQISLSQVNNQLKNSGQNIPIGKSDENDKELIFRSSSEFNEIDQIKNAIVSFYSNEVPTRISDIGEVVDTLEDETSRAFVNGKKALFIDIYRQSDSNIISVVKGINKAISKMEKDFLTMPGKPEVKIIKDSSAYIQNNVSDVYEAIIISIILTVTVVLLFLANSRATLITAIALPISLISSFILMNLAGFSINVVSLLALSLAVGLLVDDAIVVTENIYRKIESGLTPIQAASVGTKEILMAVIAITLVVMSVFTPVGFMQGTIGQFLKQFGLTMSFSMLVSLFVAITIIPVLCAYLSGSGKNNKRKSSKILNKFNQFQIWLEGKYEHVLNYSIDKPQIIISITTIIFIISITAAYFVPKTFMAANDSGELRVSLELEPDANLNATNKTAEKIDDIIRQNPEVELTAMTVGSRGSSQANKANIYVRLKNDKERNITTEDFKQKLRKKLKDFSYANPAVKDYDPSSGASRGGQPFNLYLISANQKILENYSNKLIENLKQNNNFKDVNSSNKDTRVEFRINIKNDKAKLYGINPQTIGEELRGYIEGYTPSKLRQNDLEYEIRVRLQENQRDLRANFNNIFVPNVNQKLIKLSDIAFTSESKEATTINRQNRGRYIQITASLAKDAGLGDIINNIEKSFAQGDFKLPPEIRYSFVGDSENIQDLQNSIGTALFLAVLFIYLILASLYESFITPFTILIALPLALCGAFLALFITGESLNIFTVLGIFMLLGVCGKNSILLVDFTNHLIEKGNSRKEALIAAGKARLRPILMTSFALIAGTIPIAIGLSAASKPRSAMGIAIIGGLISSTILTLIVVPAIFSYVDRFRIWIRSKLKDFIS
jgi:hydrophobic/amphiphilic exporter-1 (mainly G- bacteria), HAE1 family